MPRTIILTAGILRGEADASSRCDDRGAGPVTTRSLGRHEMFRRRPERRIYGARLDRRRGGAPFGREGARVFIAVRHPGRSSSAPTIRSTSGGRSRRPGDSLDPRAWSTFTPTPCGRPRRQPRHLLQLIRIPTPTGRRCANDVEHAAPVETAVRTTFLTTRAARPPHDPRRRRAALAFSGSRPERDSCSGASASLDERSVDAASQPSSSGRAAMRSTLRRAARAVEPEVRLPDAAYGRRHGACDEATRRTRRQASATWRSSWPWPR